MENMEVLQEFKILETDSSFITKNAKMLGDSYPQKFIAVWDSKIVAVDSNFEI